MRLTRANKPFTYYLQDFLLEIVALAVMKRRKSKDASNGNKI